MMIFKNIRKNGFTLVELLVVIAIIAILFAVILIAINPAQRFKDSRNARRLSDVQSIVGAATTYVADRRGSQLPDVPDYQCIGTKPATVVSDTNPIPRAHWKFDNDADSSVGGFNGTTSETGYANSAKLDQGLILQNPLYGVSVPETVDDALTNALTIEGWIKLNQKVEPGSFDRNQAIFDKGNYRLQLNSDSGKLEWDISIAPPPPVNEYTTAATDDVKGINVFANFQNALYAGAIRSSDSYGRILKKSNNAWSVISDYPGNSSGSVDSLAVYNEKLYVGHSKKNLADLATVYVYDGATWSDTNLGNSAGSADVLVLTRYRGKLYAGLGSLSGASVWEYDGISWRSSNLFADSDAVAVYALTVFNGKLYAGTGKLLTDNDPRLYEFNGNIWIQKYGALDFGGKDGVYSFAIYDKKLYIGLGGDAAVAPLDGQVYEWSGGLDSPVQKGTNGGAYKPNVLALGVYNGTLYGSWSGSAAADGQIHSWNLSTSAWSAATPTGTPEIRSFIMHQGEEYIATRGSAASHAKIFSYGNNGFLESQKSKWLPNVWYHIAGVYDGTNSQMKILINGAVDATQTSGVPGSIAANTQPLYLGIGYGSDAFSGVIDDFAAHHSVLSDTDIASHAGCYNLGQYLVSEYMGALPIDPSSSVTDGTDTGYFISKDTSGVVTITAPLTEITSSIPELIKASR